MVIKKKYFYREFKDSCNLIANTPLMKIHNVYTNMSSLKHSRLHYFEVCLGGATRVYIL